MIINIDPNKRYMLTTISHSVGWNIYSEIYTDYTSAYNEMVNKLNASVCNAYNDVTGKFEECTLDDYEEGDFWGLSNDFAWSDISHNCSDAWVITELII